jgi:hypothetical protein
MSTDSKLIAFQNHTAVLAELAKLNGPLIVMQSALALAHSSFMDLIEGRMDELTQRELSDEEREGMVELTEEMDAEHQRMLRDMGMTDDQFSRLGMDGMNSVFNVWNLTFNNRGASQ